MENVKKKRGRPRKEGARRNRVSFRMTDDELEMFKYVCEARNKSTTEVLLDSIKTSYNLEKYRNS